MNRLVKQIKNFTNITTTENGAKTFKSTLSNVLDFFYLAPTRQGQDNTALFQAAYEENPKLALKAALYLRDIRGGKGQRKTFRDILRLLARYEHKVFDQIVPFVPEYGRWDDILPFFNDLSVRNLVEDQLHRDLSNLSQGKNVSLLGKWMPSENVKGKGLKAQNTRDLASAWTKALEMTPRQYRRILTGLRSKIGVVETDMSDGTWKNIDYPYVPSRAMKLYRKAFYRHDTDRFDAFVKKAVKGEVKIQSGTLYPHEIVAHYLHGGGRDDTLEAQWNQLPNFLGDTPHNTLVVVDTSSSMNAKVSSKSQIQAMDVSVALGIYCAERNTGDFKNIIMTFNSTPAFCQITGKSLSSKVAQVRGIPWGGSTNLQATFQQLLEMAVDNNVSSEEMPNNIVIITDGEFNRQIEGKTNFEGIKDQYAWAGYEMPLVTFWNVCARNNQVPVTKNEKNVFLVSGFSAETIGKVLQAENLEEKTPEELMLNVLNSERYAVVDKFDL